MGVLLLFKSAFSAFGGHDDQAMTLGHPVNSLFDIFNKDVTIPSDQN